MGTMEKPPRVRRALTWGGNPSSPAIPGGSDSRSHADSSTGHIPRSFSAMLPGRKNYAGTGSIDSIPESADVGNALNEVAVEIVRSSVNSSPPVSLEGALQFRKCGASENLKSWRLGYVVFDMRNRGSLACYKNNPLESNTASNVSNNKDTLRGSLKRQPTARLSDTVPNYDDLLPRIYLPEHVNWVVKDIQHNEYGFIIEIPADEPLLSVEPLGNTGSLLEEEQQLPNDLKDDIERAQARGQTFRIYFRCSRSGNEKLLWLRAFEQNDRLSYQLHRQRGLGSVFRNPNLQISHSRIRSQMARFFAHEGKVLELSNKIFNVEDDDDRSVSSIHDDPGMRLRERTTKVVGNDVKEHLVYPLYAYPNRWMTESELYAEMVKPSDQYFDLRRPDAPQKEIGTLKVEILQCVGLPALDFASETDAVAYMVCGSYAFTSDVIWNRLNPIWLPRSRRACIFPLFHSYARLYVGIFDDDGKGEKDDFAGRVVVDLARCRPRTTYDVTLPLRLSAHVYSRRPRGSVRLRFSIDYNSEREALLSYIPKKIRQPTVSRPDDDVTVVCADEKAFRNIVTTVHGIHMPGRFSFAEWRATMREANFARKVAQNVVTALMLGIIKYENPSLSMLIFCAWMHGVYRNAFSLVPLYLVSFLLLMMVRSYAFYGSDGPIQDGFIPPSWEEMFMALVKGGEKPRIEPLKTKIQRPSRRGFSTDTDRRIVVEARTHVQRGNWLFWLLGFEKNLGPEADPEEYHMEFPYSRGLRNPATRKTHYPKFTVTESLVAKSGIMGTTNKSKRTVFDDGDENILGDLFSGGSRSKKAEKRRTLDFLGSSMKVSFDSGRRKSHPPQPVSVDAHTIPLDRQAASPERKPDSRRVLRLDSMRSNSGDDAANFNFDDLPPRLRIPEQNADAKGPTRKKKLGDELAELRDNLHRLTLHLFNDRTHRVRRQDACYFGTADRGRPGQIDNELERLLNTGQYSSANPVVARVGLYVEPIISAAHSGLCLTRVVYNVFTWRDPFLSFWVTIVLLVAAVILAVFPWRLFLFVTGFIVVGPQNYVFRVMQERGTTPPFIQNLIEKREKQIEARKVKREMELRQADIPRNQPIISCHTSDNAPPPMLSFEDVDPREIHEVVIPYSQLMYHRMYDWPPEPKFAKCEPTADLERASQRSQRVRTASGGLSSSLHRRHVVGKMNSAARTTSNDSLGTGSFH